MGGISYSDERIDVNETSIDTAVVSVPSSATELKVGPVRNGTRQQIILYNDGLVTAYIGASGVSASGANKGVPLVPRQTAVYALGDVGLYGVVLLGSTNIIVQELT